ncbi:transposase [Streptomyces chiangmaiensis]
MITIGIDPHKSSHTAVAVEAAGHQLAQRRFVVNAGTVRQLIRWCAQWPERRFAVEGAKGLGRSLAQQLAAAGEQVVDVPSTLSARVRLLATGKDRKTDAADALHVAQVALQSGVSMLRSLVAPRVGHPARPPCLRHTRATTELSRWGTARSAKGVSDPARGFSDAEGKGAAGDDGWRAFPCSVAAGSPEVRR